MFKSEMCKSKNVQFTKRKQLTVESVRWVGIQRAEQPRCCVIEGQAPQVNMFETVDAKHYNQMICNRDMKQIASEAGVKTQEICVAYMCYKDL